MDKFTTELMTALTTQHDLKEFFRQKLEDAINLLLERELTVFLDYEKWDVEAKDTENKRNGYYWRDFKTEYGVLHLRICRDRLGEFHQRTLPYRKRSSDDLETTIIKLYSRGITTRQVSQIIEEMYGHYYSAATVSQLSKIVDEDVKAFHNRRVKSKYVAVFCDATGLNLRRENVEKEALHVFDRD